MNSSAQEPRYRIETEGRAYVANQDRDGKPGLYVTVQFKLLRPDGEPAWDVGPDEIVVEEDGRRVADLQVRLPAAAGAFTGVLAVDVSGSMAARAKMDQAKQAAQTFLDRLHRRTQCGLIFFDHLIRSREAPTGDRDRLRELVRGAQPLGGTAYLDATAESVAMLRDAKGRKAAVVLTDGVDLNSRRSLDEVIEQARAADVPVYTVGVGEPGKIEPVTTVLVLDRSGSMAEPSGDGRPKIVALQEAAARFVDLMRPQARAALVPFSSRVEDPGPLTADKAALKRGLRALRPGGGTKLYDATFAAVEAIAEVEVKGKKAVVVLTDGVDQGVNGQPGSDHTVDDVIDVARRLRVPVHTIGFGPPEEINEEVLRQIAVQTGGSFHHARDEQRLNEMFEDLSIRLHDDGIDEASLRKLAEGTGGKYYPAHDLGQLRLIYAELAEELQNTYTVTFPSRRQSHDGTSRGLDISVVRGGVRVSDVARFDYAVRGLVVPDLDAQVYLGSLAVLGTLLAVPAARRRLRRGRAEA